MFRTGSGNAIMGPISDFLPYAEKIAAAPALRPQQTAHRASIQPGGSQHKWGGSFSTPEAFRMARDGDVASVALSDKVLNDIEGKIQFPTAKRVTVDDVVGAFPNVPAFIAGTPLTMRRRVKREDDAAPLAVVVNLSASSTVPASELVKRGMAVLAFVRIITNIRPVELWVGITSNVALGGYAGSCRSVYARVDTAPMDLARAGFYFGNPAFLRHIMHETAGASHPELPHSLPLAGEGFEAHIKSEFAQYTDILAMPELRGTGIGDPVKWVLDNLKKYGEA